MDHRDYARYRNSFWKSIDESRMVGTIKLWNDEGGEEIVKVPIKFEVCEDCDGKGTYVNPNIDRHGLTAEDFAEDPDFFDEYRNGRYDVTCEGCGGKRVVPEMIHERIDPQIIKRIEEMIESERESRMIQESERRMGA